MNTHQALGHMRSLMNAQHLLHQAHLRSKAGEIPAAKKLAESAYKEMSLVKHALDSVKDLTAPISMLRMFYDDLNKQRVDVVEKEIIIAEKAARAKAG